MRILNLMMTYSIFSVVQALTVLTWQILTSLYGFLLGFNAGLFGLFFLFHAGAFLASSRFLLIWRTVCLQLVFLFALSLILWAAVVVKIGHIVWVDY